MTKITRREFVKVGSTVAAAGLLAGCYPARQATPTDVPTGTPTPIPTETPTPIPEQEGWMLRRALPKPAMAAGRAFAHNDKIYVLQEGDIINQEPGRVCEYAPDGDQWEERAQMITVKQGFQAVLHQGTLYAIGGLSGGTTVNSFEAYDPTTDEWTRLADMSVARRAIGAVMVDGLLYAISGWDRGEGATGIVEAYDFGENVWQRRADMPSPRGWGGTLEVNGKIYCIAGFNMSWRNDFQVYDPQRDEWQELNNDLVPAYTQRSVPLENKIYLFCNWPLRTAVYDIETDQWEAKTPMPTPRGDFHCRVIGQRIYLIGGWVASGVVSDAVEAYDPATDTWEQLSNLNVARWNCGDVILNHNLYVLGGLTTFRESNSRLTDTVEVLALG